MICFLDMDGVLVDFNKGIHEFYDTPYSEKDFPYKKGCGSRNTLPKDAVGIHGSDFWDALTEDFWADLPWMETGRSLLSSVECTFGLSQICLLTRTTGVHCASGKIRWIQNNIPRYSDRFLIGRVKKFCAHDRAVLVDDDDQNLKEFVNCGGHGVLVPQIWNSDCC